MTATETAAAIILANENGISVMFRPQADGTVKVTITTIATQEDGTRIHRTTMTKFQARVKFAKLLESGFCKW